MTDNDTANMRGQWRLEAAGMHMRADNTEAGKLVRLADVVLWLIEAKELPRKAAVACGATVGRWLVGDVFRKTGEG